MMTEPGFYVVIGVCLDKLTVAEFDHVYGRWHIVGNDCPLDEKEFEEYFKILAWPLDLAEICQTEKDRDDGCDTRAVKLRMDEMIFVSRDGVGCSHVIFWSHRPIYTHQWEFNVRDSELGSICYSLFEKHVGLSLDYECCTKYVAEHLLSKELVSHIVFTGSGQKSSLFACYMGERDSGWHIANRNYRGVNYTLSECDGKWRARTDKYSFTCSGDTASAAQYCFKRAVDDKFAAGEMND